ncbi:MAG: DHH family phosphoesterase [Clostridia bacterium]|nr:DHH family phosphoesterase [Clostridia bacterium]
MSFYPVLTVADVVERLSALRSPLVLMHRHPDGDTVGSGVALMHVLKEMGIPAAGLCADTMPERLAFLSDAFPIYTSLPEGEHEIVAVDVPSVQQMGELGAVLTGKHAPCLMIDHHAVGTPFAPNLIDANAAAAGELVYLVAEKALHMGLITQIPVEAKRAIYAALSSDTGCFRYSNTTSRTLRIAAILLEDKAVNSAEINHLLFEAKTERQLLAEAYAIEHTKTAEGGKIAWVTVTQADRLALGVEEEHLDTVIDMVRSRIGVEIAFFIRESKDGSFKASLRSSGFNVAEVASLFGGGDHVRAAGCTTMAASIDAAVKSLLDTILKRI